MPRALVFLTLGLLFLGFADPARAEKRVALVIGISNYQQVPRLNNPVRDAEAMGALFKKAGFDVVDEKRDIGIADLRRAVREFSEKSQDADIAVVYYAGHGIEVDGANYLVPADAKLASDLDVEDETISLERVLRGLDPVKRLRLVILDACRDNPFTNSMKRTLASRSIGRGLAKVEPMSTNTLVAFSTRAGAVTDDGDGKNSEYVSALVRYIAEPGLDVRVALGRVRDEVLRKTFNRQEPFVYGSLGGDTLALVPEVAKPAETRADVRVDYEYAAQIGTKALWESFLSQHPDGFYADLARAQIERLATAERSQSAADDARRQAQEQVTQKAEKLQSATQAAAAKQQLVEQAKALEEAKKQAELAQVRADAARQQAEQARRQAVEEAQRQVEQAKAKDNAGKVAALTPSETDRPAAPPPSPQIGQADIARLLQAHLKRVGCNTGKIDGDWDESSQHALALFNKNAKTKFETRVASLEALDGVRSQHDRVCPLVCDRGERVSGDRCVEIGCARGYFLNSRGSCEKHVEPPAKQRAVQARQPRVYVGPGGGGSPALPAQRSSPGEAPCGLDGSGHRDNTAIRCRGF